MSAPATLPADFFNGPKKGEAPDTLPADFFEKQEAAQSAPTGDVSDPTKGYTNNLPLRMAQEGTLGLASGYTGLPESQSPLTDFAKGLLPTSLGSGLRSIAEFPLAPAKALYGIGKGLYGAGKEFMTSNEPEQVMHGLGSLTGQGLQLGTLAKGAEAAPEAIEGMQEARGKVGDFAHNPRTGTPKSVPRLMSDTLINTLFPESEGRVAGRQYEQRAQDLMRREQQQRSLEARAARLGQGLSLDPNGIEGSIGNAKGRLVLTPGEELARKQMDKIATAEAKRKGMYYPAGMRPEASHPPRAATPTSEVPYQSRGKVWNPDTKEWEEK